MQYAMNTLSAIPIQTPMIDGILNGHKVWEIRSKFTKKIGHVALIRTKSGTVVGTANLAEVIPLNPKLAYENTAKMGFRPLSMDEAKELDGMFAWVLKDVVKFKTPVPYKHPSGAVTWVTLDEATTKRVLEEEKRSK